MSAAGLALVFAMLAQMAFTFVVMVRAGRARFAAARARRTTGNIALDSGAWPDDVRKIVNNMNNQFETPTLFYALVLLALATGGAGWTLAVLAWGYVATRVVHSAIHTGSNRVLPRFRVFLAGLGMLIGMAVVLAVHAVRLAVA